jgi:hypothetical protein
MLRLTCSALAFFAWANSSSAVRADEFTIELKAQAAKDSKTAEARHSPSDKKGEPRAVLSVANTAVTLKWTARKTDQGAIAKDVLVHFFVVKIDKPDQQEVPKLTKGVAAESALKMDFKTQDKAEGEITLTLPGTGCYLVRLELKGIAGKSGNDPFAALDVLVR